MDNTVWTELKSREDEGLRDYQKDKKREIYECFEDYRSVMLQMPTGTGKTRLFASILKDLHNYGAAQKKAVRVLVLAHRVELIDQIADELSETYGLGCGTILSGDREKPNRPIQVASIQTLSRRLDNWNDYGFDIIIVDEAHHIPSDSYQKVIKTFPNAKLLGVTATPYRLSGEGFKDTFERLIVSKSVREFIDEGWLSEYDYYSVKEDSFIKRNVDKLDKTSYGDYDESEMTRICNTERIRAQIVEAYEKYAKGKKGIIYTINKKHNIALCEKFKEKGYNVVGIDSSTPADERNRLVADFRRGKIDIICNVNIFSEGFDCPDIEFIQLARPTMSLALYLQQVGRGLRISGKKEKTIILDNVGLYYKFGMPSSKRDWFSFFYGKEKMDSSVKESAKRIGSKRKDDEDKLAEGNEQVYLIATSDEEYYQQRKAMFKGILESIELKWDEVDSKKAALKAIKAEKIDVEDYAQYRYEIEKEVCERLKEDEKDIAGLEYITREICIRIFMKEMKSKFWQDYSERLEVLIEEVVRKLNEEINFDS